MSQLPAPEQFLRAIITEENRAVIQRTLPPHIKPERFERNLFNALVNNPKLLNCSPQEVFREVGKIAALGLVLDSQLGEAYLITGWNSVERREVPQIRIGYRGLIKLARQSGEVAQIYAHEVREGDQLDVSLGDTKQLVHKPKPFGNAAIVGYYAVAKYSDGTSDFEMMSQERANEIRDRSDGWKAFQAGKIKSTPWGTDPVEMAKKTVIRNLAKRLPQSAELAEAFGIEDRAEFGEMKDITPAAHQVSPPAPPPTVEEPKAIEQRKPASEPKAKRSTTPYVEQAAPPAQEPEQEQAPAKDFDKLVDEFRRELSRCITLQQIEAVGGNFRLEINQAPSDYRAECKRIYVEHQARVTEQATEQSSEADEKSAQRASPRPVAAPEGGSESAEQKPSGDVPSPPPPDDEDGGGDAEEGYTRILFEAAMKVAKAEGRRRLTFHLGRLNAEDRDLLRPLDTEMYTAADAFDATQSKG